jgi:hypothetical protein
MAHKGQVLCCGKGVDSIRAVTVNGYEMTGSRLLETSEKYAVQYRAWGSRVNRLAHTIARDDSE